MDKKTRIQELVGCQDWLPGKLYCIRHINTIKSVSNYVIEHVHYNLKLSVL